jgi:hypothetical protein
MTAAWRKDISHQNAGCRRNDESGKSEEIDKTIEMVRFMPISPLMTISVSSQLDSFAGRGAGDRFG